MNDRPDAGVPFYALIPAGGSGTRLWPLSRAGRPKFLLDFGFGAGSLLQATQARLAPLAAAETTYVITGSAHAADVARQLPNLPASNILIEPAPRNTAPAIGLAAALIHRRDPDAVMGSFAADHLVSDDEAFRAAVSTAIDAAAQDLLVTVGITPTAPETGYGYVHCGGPIGDTGAYHVREFVEKPARTVAEQYLRDGHYLWNASMFVWRAAAFLAELQRQQPQLYRGVLQIAEAWDTDGRERVLAEIWPTLPAEPVDTAIMEGAGREGRVATVPAEVGWNDVGDWDTLASVVEPGGGLGPGTVLSQDSGRNLVYAGSQRLVAVVGVQDLVIVDTEDALLVCRRDRAQQIKDVVARIHRSGRDDLL